MENKHRWSGWPGAFCHYCGISDPMEWAIANDFYDPYTHTWAETPDAMVTKHVDDFAGPAVKAIGRPVSGSTHNRIPSKPDNKD